MKCMAALVLVLLAAPVAAGVQISKPARAGLLCGVFCTPAALDSFFARLGELGYVVGRNLTLEERREMHDRERVVDLARELVAMKPDVLVGLDFLAAGALAWQTREIPIIGGIRDINSGPFSGRITSLSKPGMNVTGLTFAWNELTGKRLQVLKEMVPGVTRVGVLWDRYSVWSSALQGAAQALGIKLEVIDLTDLEGLEQFVATAPRRRMDAVLVGPQHFFLAERDRVANAMTRARLPAMYEFRPAIEAGGLIAYGPNVPAMFRTAADYVARVLRGANPADLPIEQPTKFELVINLKTAKALGLTIPPSVLARADEVIE